MPGQRGFFDLDERYAALSAAGDPLERLASAVDFEVFRRFWMPRWRARTGTRGDRPPYDAVRMFKVLVLQALYGLSDEQAGFQLRDRLSFRRFVGLELHDPVPDAKTIWPYREQLKRAGAIDRLFRRFNAVLAAKGYLAMGGQITGATIVAAPEQKLTADERAVVKAGGTPAGWSKSKRRQKDRDARWTLKRGRARPKPEDGAARTGVEIAVPVFGYKSHLDIDRRHRLILAWSVTHAAAQTAAACPTCSIGTASPVRADTAYRTKRNLETLQRRGLRERIQFRRPPRRRLSGPRARANAARAKVRSAIEYVSARQKRRMAPFVRTIGLARARVKIGLANLACNFTRLAWLDTRTAPA